MGVSLPNGPSKFKLFNLLSKTHEIFRVRKYKAKIKFDKNLRVSKYGVPPYGVAKIETSTIYSRQMKFSEPANMKER